MSGNGDRGAFAQAVPAISDHGIIPSAPLFIVMRSFGRLGDEAIVDPNQTREGVIADMITGQVENVLYVIECLPLEGSAKDVSEDIARAIADRVQREPISDDLISFIGAHAGVVLANEMRRAA